MRKCRERTEVSRRGNNLFGFAIHAKKKYVLLIYCQNLITCRFICEPSSSRKIADYL